VSWSVGVIKSLI